ncbi:RsmB/NOP family class I SAM-dependent RNA methyltransferase [Candidatus Woesearchaeota archaeon]|nr:RsmB/NOP family class I SAM-dependent RNA methyltransferase [Candidatus Woesearchaeota archaeon]
MVSGGREFFSKRYEQLGGLLADVKLPQTVRVNTLKITAKELLARLGEQGVVLKRVPFTRDGYWVEESKFSLGATTEFLLGYYSLQESAAQLPVEVLDPRPGELVLDCCASPGGKTTQLSARMEGRGTIVSFELKEHRLPGLLMNLERCGVENSVVFAGDVSQVKSWKLEFDRVLLDAPCSGNYLSEPGWLEKRTLDGIERSAAIQKRLLKSAVSVLKSGGVLVYSTCSLEPEEDELNIQWVLDNLPVRLEKVSLSVGDPALTQVFGKKLSPDIALCRRLWPHKTNTEGFFIAKLVKL